MTKIQSSNVGVQQREEPTGNPECFDLAGYNLHEETFKWSAEYSGNTIDCSITIEMDSDGIIRNFTEKLEFGDLKFIGLLSEEEQDKVLKLVAQNKKVIENGKTLYQILTNTSQDADSQQMSSSIQDPSISPQSPTSNSSRRFSPKVTSTPYPWKVSLSPSRRASSKYGEYFEDDTFDNEEAYEQGEKLDSKVKDLESQLADKESELQLMKKTNEELTGRLDISKKTQEEYDRFGLELDELKEKNVELESKLHKESKANKDALLEKDKKVEQLNQHIHILEQNLKDKASETKSLECSLADKESEVSSTNEINKGLREELDILEAKSKKDTARLENCLKLMKDLGNHEKQLQLLGEELTGVKDQLYKEQLKNKDLCEELSQPQEKKEDRPSDVNERSLLDKLGEESTREEIESLQRQLKERDDSKDQLEEKLLKKEKEFTDLKDQLREEQCQLKKKEDMLTHTEEELKSVKESLGQLQNILQQEKNQTATSTQTEVEYESRGTSMQQQDQGTQAVNNNSSRIARRLRKENKNLTRDKLTISEQLKQKTKEKEIDDQKLRSIQKSLDGKIEELNGANQNVSRLKVELEEREVQLKKLKQELADATNEVALLNDTKKELTQEKQKTRQLNDQVTKFTEGNSQLKQEKLGQKAIIDGLTRENDQLGGQVEDLQKKLDDTNQALDTKTGEVIKLTQKNSQFGEEYENTKAQLENKNQQLDETNNRLESTQAQLEKLRQDLGEKNSEVTALTSEKSKLNDTIGKLEIQLTEKRQTLDATNRRVSQLEQEISMLKQSQQQIEKVDISTQTGIWSNSDDYNQKSTSENNATDLGGYSLFLKGISNRLKFYDIDQRCETEKIADEYVEHTSSYQGEIDDSLTHKSDSDWKGDRYYYISPNAYYPISPKDSALIKLDLTLTDNEKSLISEFYKELSEMATKSDKGYRDKHESATNNALKHIKYITDKYLLKGIRLNSKCNDDKYTVTSLIFKEMRSVLDRMPECDIANDENVEITRNIINSLLLRGGRVKRSSFYERRLLYAIYGFSYEIFAEREEIDNKLKSAAYEGVINSSTQGKVLQAEVDNRHFYMKYSQDSTVEAAKVINDPKIKDLDLRCCVFHIGESIVRVENVGEKRNYVDLAHNSDIALTFHTSEGELEVRLYPDMQNKDLIRVEVGNQGLLERLKNCNEKIGKNCLLGGLPVNQAIEQGFFVRPGKLMRFEAMSQSNGKTGLLTKFDEITGTSSFKETVSRCT